MNNNKLVNTIKHLHQYFYSYSFET